MGEHSLLTRAGAHAFCTEIALLSLENSLKRKSMAIEQLEDENSKARAQATMVYESKVALAQQAFEAHKNAAKVVHDQALAEAQTVFDQSTKESSSIFDATQKANEEHSAAYSSACRREHDLERELAREELNFVLDAPQSADEHDQATRVFRETSATIARSCKQQIDALIDDYNEKVRSAREAYQLATGSARTALDEVSEVQSAMFKDIHESVRNARSRAGFGAWKQREEDRSKINSEYTRKYQAIRSHFAAEGKIRIALLRASRVCIDAYFDWLDAQSSAES